jgi:CheY-like chemotaxis protein
MPEAEEVLVVEDHAPIRELVRAVLEGAGYAVREAADGAAALALAGRAPPAVILLDVDLPVLDGPGFLAAYRRAPGPHAPVVLMTAAGPADAARQAAALGAAGHLGKPFGLAELLAAVGRAHASLPPRASAECA